MWCNVLVFSIVTSINHVGPISRLGQKIYCLFPISDRPYQNMCDPNLFMDFQKKKKILKLRDDLLAVVKVTKKRYQKERGGSKSVQKTKNHYVMYR